MPKAIGIDTYNPAALMPVAKLEDLTMWWKRPTPKFLPFKVQVLKWETHPDGRKDLTFQLVGDMPAGAPRGPFVVEMTRTHRMVWSDLPSTAQLASENQFGFLFLSAAWMANNSVDEAAAEGGGKWPIGADELAPLHLARQLVQVLKDDSAKTPGTGPLLSAAESFVQSCR